MTSTTASRRGSSSSKRKPTSSETSRRRSPISSDKGRKAIILDSSAFIAGYDPFSVDSHQYSVPSVRDELLEGSLSRLRFEAASERGRLKLLRPEPKFLRDAKIASREVGDVIFLSDADLEILALALQLKSQGYEPSIVTDDYSIQNVADKVNVNFAPLITFGIKFQLKWLRYCPACRKKYPPDYKFEVCEVCGTRLKRKPRGKTRIRGG